MVVFGIVGNFEQEKVVTDRIDGAEKIVLNTKQTQIHFIFVLYVIKNK